MEIKWKRAGPSPVLAPALPWEMARVDADVLDVVVTCALVSWNMAARSSMYHSFVSGFMIDMLAIMIKVLVLFVHNNSSFSELYFHILLLHDHRPPRIILGIFDGLARHDLM
jgi:hypothetical protein